MKGSVRQKQFCASFFIFSFFLFLFLYCGVPVHAATTTYKGIDYARVYDFDYYVSHNAYVKKHYSNNPKKALKYFVKKGMKKRQQAIASFNVNSYIYGNKDLRRLYKNNYKKYYLHYIKKGYKSADRRDTAKRIKKMTNYCVRYDGVVYSSIYDYNYYISHNKDVKKKYGVDDLGAFEDFMERGIYKGLQGNASFNVKKYMEQNPSLKKLYGKKYEKYYFYYVKHGSKNNTKTSTTKETATLLSASSTAKTKAKTESDSLDDLPVYQETSASTPSASSTGSGRKYATSTINGKKTLKTYLQNAMVPVGRTLYIWGGGWGDSDSSIIGYQKQWNTFFTKHNKASYNYDNYRYSYGNGLDCSGFAAWTIYNTLYTKSGMADLVCKSSSVAGNYNSRGWASLSKNGSDSVFKPGDVVSMDGHVWISLGQCSDKSILLVHSSPKGVQISGTAGKAATLAKYYMRKYFPEWPYEARTVGSGYLSYVGKARWKVSGGVLKDPEGIQKMSANQCMKAILGA